jgi:hypothetical protein
MKTKVIILPENLHAYLMDVLKSHSLNGLEPEEAFFFAETWNRIKVAPFIDYSKLGEAKIESISPEKVELSLEEPTGFVGDNRG